MTIETFLLGLVIGVIAGWLASVVVQGGSSGLFNDLMAGVVGAFLGGLLFRGDSWRPWRGLPGEIFVAFIGAIIVLLLLRAIIYLRARARRPPPGGA